MSEVEARVEVRDGQLVLIDPAAEGVIAAVEAHNRVAAAERCCELLRVNAERVRHFLRRMDERKDKHKAVCIVIAHVDDPVGRVVADGTMPGFDWQPFRDRGETPIARGLAGRDAIQALALAATPGCAYRINEADKAKQRVIFVFDAESAAVYTPDMLEGL